MRIVAKTLLWLREQQHEAGTEFAVVETPAPKATKPVEVDAGTATLWLRHGKAAEVKPGRKVPDAGEGA